MIAITTAAPAAAEQVGALSGPTTTDEGFLADKVGVLLHSIPADVQKLLIFTQCHGGDVATDASVTGLPNAAIASGTSAGEPGSTGGYHDDAARALRPENGRTGRTVHDAGVAGKHQTIVITVGRGPATRAATTNTRRRFRVW